MEAPVSREAPISVEAPVLVEAPVSMGAPVLTMAPVSVAPEATASPSFHSWEPENLVLGIPFLGVLISLIEKRKRKESTEKIAILV